MTETFEVKIKHIQKITILTDAKSFFHGDFRRKKSTGYFNNQEKLCGLILLQLEVKDLNCTKAISQRDILKLWCII